MKSGIHTGDDNSGTFAAGHAKSETTGGAPAEDSGILTSMRRFLHILLLALVLGPSIGPVFRPAQDACADEQPGCCKPDGLCDHTCPDCECCTPSAISLSRPASIELLDGPPALRVSARVDAPPSTPPADILHVPKSV